ncbi:MAG: GTP-sensing pleiotropic transcriptional regulator CodY [Lachnospiraceae bacterium]|nr:GTP-sensing pleiotropic transcriptional regulator CodY [Lachnospiraceae bacterium]MDY6220769.1 GTP-sensing pleiotropic transcriptional regulator CodY [Candidatus Alectryocaccobium sp.]
MSVLLLDNTRKINKLLHNNTSSKVVFNDICRIMTDCLDSNILVISNKGKILGASTCPTVSEIGELICTNVGNHIDEHLNDRLLNILSTQDNVNLNTLGFETVDPSKTSAIISPIEIAAERLGTIFIYRSFRSYDIDDIILAEYGTTVVGLEILRSENEAIVEEKRKKQVVKSAIRTLSSSELAAAIQIFDELKDNEGLLIASKIADKAGITRSVIVNAIRKFESAGVIESHSGGMKGTYIKIVNNYLMDELHKYAHEQ